VSTNECGALHKRKSFRVCLIYECGSASGSWVDAENAWYVCRWGCD